MEVVRPLLTFCVLGVTFCHFFDLTEQFYTLSWKAILFQFLTDLPSLFNHRPTRSWYVHDNHTLLTSNTATNLPHFPEDDFQDSVKDEKCSINEGEQDGIRSHCHSNVKIVLHVINGQSCSKEEENDKALHDIDVVFLVRFYETENRQTQHNQHAMDKLQKRE